MRIRRSLSHLLAFVLAGAGASLVVIWFYGRWGWLESAFFDPSNTLFVLLLVSTVGIGLFTGLGFEIGRARASRSPGADRRGAALSGFALSLLVLLGLGALFGLILTVPAALAPPNFLYQGSASAFIMVFAYALLVGASVVIPASSGLLASVRATPSAWRALVEGMALGVGGIAAFTLPAILLVVLIHPSCAMTPRPSCGPWYSPTLSALILGSLAVWAALPVSVVNGVAAGLGVLVAQRTDRRHMAAPSSAGASSTADRFR